jgi:hypothetical protein
MTVALLLVVENIFSQRLVEQNQIKDFYLQKSKNQKTTGLILAGAGTALIVVGGYVFDKSWDEVSATTTDIAGFAVLTGVLADLASIPYFISSCRNKKKAATFSLGYQSVYFGCDNTLRSGIKPVGFLKVNF